MLLNQLHDEKQINAWGHSVDEHPHSFCCSILVQKTLFDPPASRQSCHAPTAIFWKDLVARAPQYVSVSKNQSAFGCHCYSNSMLSATIPLTWMGFMAVWLKRGEVLTREVACVGSSIGPRKLAFAMLLAWHRHRVTDSVTCVTAIWLRFSAKTGRAAVSELALITSPICPLHGAKWAHMVPHEVQVRTHENSRKCGVAQSRPTII